MLTLAAPHQFSQEIRKSRFLALAAPVADEAEARRFFAAHADPAATHNCWAWKAGALCRAFDDGEPSGTAGRPILLAIETQGLDGVAVLVIRWFGGILLGSGGLMRAYGGTAATCLREAPKDHRIARVDIEIHCPFADLARLKARLLQAGAVNRAERFDAEGALLTVALPEAELDQAMRMIRDVTRGRGRLRLTDGPATA